MIFEWPGGSGKAAREQAGDDIMDEELKYQLRLTLSVSNSVLFEHFMAEHLECFFCDFHKCEELFTIG
jgi:hypothetical protein